MEIEEIYEIHRDLLVLHQDLVASKAQIDSDPAVRLSRRLQGAIAKCSELSNRLTELEKGHNDTALLESEDVSDKK